MLSLAMVLLLAAPPKVGDAAPPLSCRDVMDRPVAAPDAGSVMVLSFASRSTGEKAGELTRGVRVRHPDVKILSFIDLSGFPGFMRGLIKGRIVKRQPGAVKDARDAFVKAGKTPPEDLDARIHIIPDFDAKYCKAYGANDTGHQAKMVVIGSDGTIKAAFSTTPSLDDLNAAVDKEAGGK